MFEKEQEEFLIRKLQRNEVVLFIGAGFSIDALNKNNEQLPLGNQFAQKIWSIIYPTKEYEITPLPILYELLIKSGKPRNEIVDFLTNTFLVKSFPDFYKKISIPYWYKIYTTNIDNLLDKIYIHSSQDVDVLKFPHDDHKDIDKSLSRIQHIYLNGKLPCNPEEIIFSRNQYAKEANKINHLYNQFVADYATNTTIFLGSALDEPLFEQYLASRQERKSEISEYRPQSFLIDPYLSDAKIDFLKLSYNIVGIKKDSLSFLKWIEINRSQYENRYEVIKISNPALVELADTLGKEKIKNLSEQLNDFAEGFRKVSFKVKSNRKGKDYLQGTSPSWNDIYNELDAPRKITEIIFHDIEKIFSNDDNKVEIIAILGSAGCGKSTILKRLSLKLVQNGRSCFLSYSEYIPDINSIVEVVNTYEHRVCLMFDNADLMLHSLHGVTEQFEKCIYKPIIVIAARTNVFDRLINKFNIQLNFNEYDVPNLDRDEIVEIIRVLDENNLLGHLKGMSESQRIYEFEKRSKKQILVAMREATKGDSFDNIIKSEFNEIAPMEAKFLAGCIALTTEAGFTVSIQDFVLFSNVAPANTLQLLKRNLRNIVITVGGKENLLLFRHRAIADYIINNCMNPDQLKSTYLKILTTLASEININNWKSRKFSLYREIINHLKVYKRFRYNIENARELYESLIPYFRNDFHLWIQYGSLEMEGKGGNLDLAENYILQAQSLRPSNNYVKNALANLYFKKSKYSKVHEVSIDYRNKANEIITPIIEDIKIENPYTYHIYCKGNYDYITKHIKDKIKIQEELTEVKQVLEHGISLNPQNRKLGNLLEILNKAILLTVVDGTINFPIILDESELE